MKTNALPHYDESVNTTGCCPQFNPGGWDDQVLHFDHKRFLRAVTHSVMHMPVDMGRVFTRVQKAIADADAQEPGQMIVISRELSPFKAEHFFAVDKPVPGEEMTALSGDWLTKVFEGSYSQMGAWADAMEQAARERGTPAKSVAFFYTTCPKCAKAYGRNYVIGLAEV